MKRIVVLMALLLMFTVSVFAGEGEKVRIGVKLEDGYSLNLPTSIPADQEPTPDNLYNSIFIKRLTNVGNWEIIETNKQYADDVIKLLKKKSFVITAEKDRFYKLQSNRLQSNGTSVLDDPYYYAQEWYFNLLGAEEGLVRTYGSDLDNATSNVVVAVIDSGVNYNHEDLQDSLWVNKNEIAGNGIDDDNNGYVDDIYGINVVDSNTNIPIDEMGHGTFITSIISAGINNGIGIEGLSKAKVLMCDVIGDTSGQLSELDVLECVNYIIGLKNNGENIVTVNMSFGGEGISDIGNQIISSLADNGILAVVAAGNEYMDLDKTLYSPASFSLYYDNVITVGALDSRLQKSDFSNYGKYTVSIFAPGDNLAGANNLDNFTYYLGSGTSYAAPVVTALVAAISEKHPDYNYKQIKSLILSSGKELPSLKGLCQTGSVVQYYNDREGGVTNCNPQYANKLVVTYNSTYGDNATEIIADNYNCEVKQPITSVSGNYSGDGSFTLMTEQPFSYDIVMTGLTKSSMGYINNFPVLLKYITPLIVDTQNNSIQDNSSAYSLTTASPLTCYSIDFINSYNQKIKLFGKEYSSFMFSANGVLAFYENINRCLGYMYYMNMNGLIGSDGTLSISIIATDNLYMVGDLVFLVNSNDNIGYGSLNPSMNIYVGSNINSFMIKYTNAYDIDSGTNSIEYGLEINNNVVKYVFNNINDRVSATSKTGVYIGSIGQYKDYSGYTLNGTTLQLDIKNIAPDNIAVDSDNEQFFVDNDFYRIPEFYPLVFNDNNSYVNTMLLTFNDVYSVNKFNVDGITEEWADCIDVVANKVSDTEIELVFTYNTVDDKCIKDNVTEGFFRVYTNSMDMQEIPVQFGLDLTSIDNTVINDPVDNNTTDNNTIDNSTTDDNIVGNTTPSVSNPTTSNGSNGGGGGGGCSMIGQTGLTARNVDIMLIMLGIYVLYGITRNRRSIKREG